MIVRPAILIPTYNNPETIGQVVLGVLSLSELTDLDILVVDDGSDLPVGSLLEKELSQLDVQVRRRVQVERFSANQGKGAALAHGFRVLAQNGFTHAIAMDGDNQHPAQEVTKLLNTLLEHPWSLIIGARKLEGPTVPKISHFGRAFSNFWVDFETGQKITDSQSGLRAYPLLWVQAMRFFTRHYDFEIEVLIRLLWKGVSVVEVPVEVYYPEKGRVSHFHKWRDNARISLLNIFLVGLGLLKSRGSAGSVGLALGLGVFVGCTPLYGLHTGIVILISMVTKLNLGALWIGTQISIPPFVPFLWGAAVYLSSEYPLISPLLGLLFVGAGLGTILGSVTYFLMKSSERKNGTQERDLKRAWTGNTRGGRFGNWFLATICKKFGVKTGYLWLYVVIPYFYIFAPKARRASHEYLRQMFGHHLSRISLMSLSMKHLFTFGQVLMDRIYQGFFREPKFQGQGHGWDSLKQAAQSGRGLLLVTAHVGAWELGEVLLGRKGLESQFSKVHFVAEGLRYQDFLEKKETPGHEIHASPDAVWEVRSELEAGRTVGMMGDRATSASHVELVSFLGGIVPIDASPFRVAGIMGKQSQAQVVHTFGFKADKEQEQLYRFFATEPKCLEAKDSDRAYLGWAWAQEYMADTEKLLREYPLQWFNFYPYFSEGVSPLIARGPTKSTYLWRSKDKQPMEKLGWGFANTQSFSKQSRHSWPLKSLQSTDVKA